MILPPARSNEPVRAFLDANVLYSAAIGGGVAALWEAPGVVLVTSEYASREAWDNLLEHQRPTEASDRLADLLSRIEVWPHMTETAPIDDWSLPDPSDVPIVRAAIASRCGVLITGDKRCFGEYFGKRLGGVLVLRPAAFLALRGA